MKKGFLLAAAASHTLAPAAAAAAVGVAHVDNLLARSFVTQRLAAGAKTLRIECDFVTCSQ